MRLPDDPALRLRVAALRTALARPRALREAGRYDEAARALDPVVAEARALGYRPLLAEALLVRGELQMNLTQGEPAREALDAAVIAAEATGHDVVSARAQTVLARVHGVVLGDKPEALRTIDHARAAAERAGNTAELLAQVEDALGEILSVFSGSAAAAAARERALALWERAAGPDSLPYAATLDGYATAIWDLGRLEEARDAYQRALAIREQALGSGHPVVATTLMNLAAVKTYLGDYEAASAMQRRVLAMRVAIFGADHPNVAIIKNNMGDVLQRMGRADEALAVFRDALATMRRSYADDHPFILAIRSNVASALLDLGRHPEAIAELRDLVGRYDKTIGPRAAETANAMARLASALVSNGDLAEGRALYRQAEAIGFSGADPGQLELGFGAALRRRGQYREALPHLEVGIAAMARAGVKNAHRLALLEGEVAECHLGLGDAAPALPLVEAALARLDTVEGVAIDQARLRRLRARVVAALR